MRGEGQGNPILYCMYISISKLLEGVRGTRTRISHVVEMRRV